MKNVLSIDWEDWYQTASLVGLAAGHGGDRHSILESTTDILLKLLGDDVKATFFVLECNARKYPNLLRSVAIAGHEIALHGLTHKILFSYTVDEFERDIVRAKETVENIINAPVLGFRAPNWSVNERTSWALDVLARQGFRYDASMTAQVFCKLSKHNQFPVFEVPRSGISIGGWKIPVASGIYFRAYPYAWTKQFILHMQKSKRTVMVCLHPWEFDQAWLRVKPLSWRARIVMGTGISDIKKKVACLLKDFKFCSVRSSLGI